MKPVPFREVLEKKDFIVTVEVAPQKGTNTGKAISHINLLKDRVDALNVTDNQSSVMRYPSVGMCLLIKENGGEPVMQATCRDKNRLAIQADLLFASSRGINNVLCLTGDAIDVGDHTQAKPVFELDSVQLINLVNTLNSGKDMAGNELNGKTDFCIGASATPSSDPVEPQLLKFRKKVHQGISFVQTQAVYDIDELKRFIEYARKLDGGMKILAGIVPVISARMAEYMNANVPGIFVPDTLITELKNTPKGEGIKKGIEIAARFIRQIKDEKVCDGVHIMFIGREERIPEILEASGLWA
ncbi:MAG: methylenetetrahydrofolate reductase [Spirochaetales bacterium]|nr:methylenetetrahydrofolate reductase [Spirochaetales bacterium]